MAKEIIAYDVPVIIKMSKLIEQFETFGDIVRASVDERKRRSNLTMNLFIAYADQIGAARAIAMGYLNINGSQIKIEKSQAKAPIKHRENNLDRKYGKWKNKSNLNKKSSNNNRTTDNSHKPRSSNNRRSPIRYYESK